LAKAEKATVISRGVMLAVPRARDRSAGTWGDVIPRFRAVFRIFFAPT